jgi:hypothetical protein
VLVFQTLLGWDVLALAYDCLDSLRLSRHVSDSAAVSWLHQLIVELGPRGAFATLLIERRKQNLCELRSRPSTPYIPFLLYCCTQTRNSLPR